MRQLVAAQAEAGFEPLPEARAKGVLQRFPWLRLSLGAGAVAMFLAYAAHMHDPRPVETPAKLVHLSPPTAPLPLWTPIARPLAIYGLDAPELKTLPFAFSARRDATGAREDDLAFGLFDQGGAPHLRMVVNRSAPSERQEPSFFLDLARRASGLAGLAIARSAPPQGLTTKFGLAEIAQVTLSDTLDRACLAFRLSRPDIALHMAGWLCPTKDQTMDRQDLACTFDRLQLIEAGNDEALRQVFLQADRQRIESCAPPAIVSSIQAPRQLAKPAGHGRQRQARQARPARVIAARKGFATPRREMRRAAGSASRDSRG